MRSSTIYIISGLGADRRAFSKLVFPPEISVIHLDWIPPAANESLINYARRLGERIDQTAPYYLIGLSFGGMLATEITRIMNPIHTFLISSIATYKELPWYYRAAGSISLQKAIPVGLLKNSNNIGYKIAGCKN
jgi:pimeloyl-ACP methyl ester carboxylesterase